MSFSLNLILHLCYAFVRSLSAEDGMQHTCDASTIFVVNEAFLQHQCGSSHSHIILNMLHLTTKPSSSPNEEVAHIN